MKPKDIKYATLIRFGMCGSPDCMQIHIDLMDDNFRVFATALADKSQAKEWIEALRKFVYAQ